MRLRETPFGLFGEWCNSMRTDARQLLFLFVCLCLFLSGIRSPATFHGPMCSKKKKAAFRESVPGT